MNICPKFFFRFPTSSNVFLPISYLKSKELSKEEMVDLNSWIIENNSFYSNPINATDDNGELLNFIEYLKTIIKK